MIYFADEPAVGVGSFITPALYVKDPINVQYILQQDFNSFNHRGIESMTPMFTSAKLKSMYIMDRSARDFVDYLKEQLEKLKADVFDTLCTFCSAAVGASVFGITTDSIFDSPFLKMAQAAMKPTRSQNMKFAIGSLNTTLFKLLGMKHFKEHEEFFISAIRPVIRRREQEKMRWHDFADIYVNLQSNSILNFWLPRRSFFSLPAWS
ncbi:unnamed protein product, partial [Iphiclides podalirius]